MDAAAALTRLNEGNRRYRASGASEGDVSAGARTRTTGGQQPYAIIVSCSDSRVIPEAIFAAGIGELFVIRVAGNVIGEHELGSIEYAADHLGCELAVVLGHTHCGAVGATIAGGASGHTTYLTRAISAAIGGETSDRHAAELNALAGVGRIRHELRQPNLTVIAGLYDIETGEVSWL